MRHLAREAVEAVQRFVGAHAVKLGTQYIEQRELLPGNAFGDEDGEIAALASGVPQHPVAVGILHRNDAGQRSERGLEVLTEGRHDEHAEILSVLSDRHPEPVKDFAASRRHQLDTQPVFFREKLIAGGVEDLQLTQTPTENAKQRSLAGADQQRAPREAQTFASVALRVAHAGAP